LQRLAWTLLHEVMQKREVILDIQLLRPEEMRQLNERWLRHRGSTDVITFDYTETELRGSGCGGRPRKAKAAQTGTRIHGEIFICLAEAVAQARRFRTNWPAELARYVIHGVLHLDGFDDTRAESRRRMKREEDRLLRELGRRLRLSHLRRRRS
jgi:probable rRNA maturation factor